VRSPDLCGCARIGHINQGETPTAIQGQLKRGGTNNRRPSTFAVDYTTSGAWYQCRMRIGATGDGSPTGLPGDWSCRIAHGMIQYLPARRAPCFAQHGLEKESVASISLRHQAFAAQSSGVRIWHGCRDEPRPNAPDWVTRWGDVRIIIG